MSRHNKNVPWWQKGIIYQVYLPSFMDSNGDGIGDLEGITQKLDYLNNGTRQSLLVDGLWITPFYPSPWADGGYDVSDYTDVDPLFGSLEIFDHLRMKSDKRGIHLIVDLVLNHTSSQHPWFLESRSSKMSQKRDWYIWQDAGPDAQPPSDHTSHFGGPAWAMDEVTGQYYYHKYLAEQPDLNLRNPEVRDAIFQIIRFWLDRGVYGSRFDVVQDMVKEHLKEIGLERCALTRDEMHEMFREVRIMFEQYKDRVMIAEVYPPNIHDWVQYFGTNLDEFHIPFNFLPNTTWSAQGLRSTVEEIERELPKGAWPNYVLGSHDIPRLATQYGPDQARLAAMFLLTLRGTPFLYYGDEIGMRNVDIPADRVRDVSGRDPERTPMQWDSSVNAGFTRGEPWLPISYDYQKVNVAKQAREPRSILSLYRNLIWFRKQHAALCLGDYSSLDVNNLDIFAYIRHSGRQKFLVALNFSGEENLVRFDSLKGSGYIVLSTELDRNGQVNFDNLILRPHEGCLIQMGQ